MAHEDSQNKILTYIHYLVLFGSVIFALYVGYGNFWVVKPQKTETRTHTQGDAVQDGSYSDTTMAERIPDSLYTRPQNLDVPAFPSVPEEEGDALESGENGSSSESSTSSESNREATSHVGSSSQEEEDVKTWMELIIDLIETLTPLLLPIISYYFQRNGKSGN